MGSTPLEDAAFVFRASRSTWPRSNRTKLQDEQSHKPRTVKSADALEPSDRACRGGSVGAGAKRTKSKRRERWSSPLRPAPKTAPYIGNSAACSAKHHLQLARAVRAGGRAETGLSGSRVRERAGAFQGNVPHVVVREYRARRERIAISSLSSGWRPRSISRASMTKSPPGERMGVPPRRSPSAWR